MNTEGNLKTLLITSTLSGEGKSWISSNLAVAFAQTGKKIILIDADLRKGRQYSIFEVLPKPGLSNYLSGIGLNNDVLEKDDILANCIQKTEIDNLDIITAGNIPPNPSELLMSTQMSKLLEDLKQCYDMIIIDGTPSQLVTDSVILSRIVDATLLVTQSKKTKKNDLKNIITNIQNVGGRILGVVINKVPISAKKYDEKYYYSSANTDKQDFN